MGFLNNNFRAKVDIPQKIKDAFYSDYNLNCEKYFRFRCKKDYDFSNEPDYVNNEDKINFYGDGEYLYYFRFSD